MTNVYVRRGENIEQRRKKLDEKGATQSEGSVFFSFFRSLPYSLPPLDGMGCRPIIYQRPMGDRWRERIAQSSIVAIETLCDFPV